MPNGTGHSQRPNANRLISSRHARDPRGPGTPSWPSAEDHSGSCWLVVSPAPLGAHRSPHRRPGPRAAFRRRVPGRSRQFRDVPVDLLVSAGRVPQSHKSFHDALLSCVHPSNDASTTRPGAWNRRATTDGRPRPCSVSLRRWAVHDGCYGVNPRGSVVVGGPADENPAGRRRGMPRWACAGQRSAGQAVDHSVSR